MNQEKPLDKEVLQWARTLRQQGLGDFFIPILDILQVWGFLGSQLLWMFAPFFNNHSLTLIAEALEQPETLQLLQQYLMEGES